MVRGMLKCGLVVAFSLPVIPSLMNSCNAQQMNRSSGGMSGSSMSSGSMAPRTTQASGFGGSSMPGMGGSTQSAAGTGFGSTPLTGIGAGLTSFGQDATGTGGFVGQNFGTGNFVGQANAANGQGQGLNQRGNQNNQRGGVNRAVQQQLNGGGFGGQNNFGGQNGGGASQQIVIRPQQRIAFDFPKPAADQIIGNTRTRFSKLASRQPALAGVGIAMNAEGVAVLTGSVVSEDQRRLAEQLVRLEPGVRNVENNLTTAP